MTKLRIRNDKNVYTLYMDPLALPDPVAYELHYGDKAYDVKNDKGYIYKGKTAGWVEHIPGPQGPQFKAEFTMADTSKRITSTSSPSGSIQHSKDGTTWIDGDFRNTSGSLKMYIRQKPGTPDITAVHFRGSQMKTVDSFDVANITSLNSLFRQCTLLESANITDTSKVTDFKQMFNYCWVIQSIDLFDTSSGTDFTEMFTECKLITSIPHFNTSKGIKFNQMLSACGELTSVPQFDTSNGEDLSYMVTACKKITSVPQFDTSKCTNFKYMFAFCILLEHIPAIDTSKGTMFTNFVDGATKLKCLTNIDTRLATNTQSMFSSTPALVAPNASDQALIAATPGINWTNPGTCP